MRFLPALSTFFTLLIAHQAFAQVTFRLSNSSKDSSCNPGTQISCTQAEINAQTCKGNFNHNCARVLSNTPKKCTLNLYTKADRQGEPSRKIPTEAQSSAVAAATGTAWKSYKVLCP
ncbi:hypothetical protein R3P38DRAFT_2766739 [Favolaschia claudopus]|uniref:Antifreeze protein n=1 Tax=Favolaschia claudopus TaxID=2862362 RepID=A0AAW0CZK4_9AGAR